jgi:hypothetical protein
MAIVENNIRGIADPSAQRACLQALDAAFLSLVAVRTRLMNRVVDDFTGLRSSAQLFREIFYGVQLPIDTPKTLMARAGGPLRIIRVSYKEAGMKTFALVDVLAAIPKFKSVFPITSFAKLGRQLEDIRESDADAEAVWFLNRISTKNVAAALAHEARLIATGQRKLSDEINVQPTLAKCGCCGERSAPASWIEDAFADFACHVPAARWTGRAPRPTPQPQPPSLAKKAAQAVRRSRAATR